jgi:threonine/homoserine/homoserine lactone efflux protein
MALSAFLLAVLLLELTPGPNMAYLATLALTRGRRAGLIAVGGVACGLAVHAIVAGFGAGALLLEYPMLYSALRWAGVGVLLYLAWDGWHTTDDVLEDYPPNAARTPSLFLRGLLSNVFNPKSILFFVSVLPGFVMTSRGALSLPAQMAIFGALYVSIATTIHALIVVLAARLPRLPNGKRSVIVRRALSIMLAGVALWLAWATRR